jgi:hypothetical protein
MAPSAPCAMPRRCAGWVIWPTLHQPLIKVQTADACVEVADDAMLADRFNRSAVQAEQHEVSEKGASAFSNVI